MAADWMTPEEIEIAVKDAPAILWLLVYEREPPF